MKGIIFNVLESYCDDFLEVGSFDEIVERILPDVKDPFVAPGTYKDEYLTLIVAEISRVKNKKPDVLLRDFGRYLFTALANRYPHFVSPYNHPKDFIKTIHDVIHVEVIKLFPDTATPNFYYSNDFENQLTIKYESGRKLYSLVEGLVDGVGEYYKSPIVVDCIEKNPNEHYALFKLSFS